MAIYVKVDGKLSSRIRNRNPAHNDICDFSMMTMAEKIFILTTLEQTNAVTTVACANIMLPHYSTGRINAFIRHYKKDPSEYYEIRDDVLTRMF